MWLDGLIASKAITPSLHINEVRSGRCVPKHVEVSNPWGYPQSSSICWWIWKIHRYWGTPMKISFMDPPHAETLGQVGGFVFGMDGLQQECRWCSTPRSSGPLTWLRAAPRMPLSPCRRDNWCCWARTSLGCARETRERLAVHESGCHP